MYQKGQPATNVTDLVFAQLDNNSNTVPAQHQKPVQLNFMRLLLQNSAGGENDGKN